MQQLPGIFEAKKKDGTVYYRASITCNGKHISLGGYDSDQAASAAYETAEHLFRHSRYTLKDYRTNSPLPFPKWVSILNYRDNHMYCKTPIYIYSNYFIYYFTLEDYLKFDVDDLFYYSKHTIQRRGGHLFVAEYGTQFNILSRYGIKNFAVAGRDYRFVNGDSTDFRYRNIEIINKYHGVYKHNERGMISYTAKIHINGDFQIGTYATEEEAAVAYNKAATLLQAKGVKKDFPKNYVLELDEISYASLYHKVPISKKIREYTPPVTEE